MRNIVSINNQSVESHLSMSSNEIVSPGLRPQTSSTIHVPISMTDQKAHAWKQIGERAQSQESIYNNSMMSEAPTVMTTSQFMRSKQQSSRIKSRRCISKIDKLLGHHNEFIQNKKQPERSMQLAEIVN